MSRLMTKPTKDCVPSEDSDQTGHPLCPQWVAEDTSFLYADSEDWVFAGCTSILFITKTFLYFDPLKPHFYMYITKICLYKFDPLKPHFYIVKLGFTGVYIIFLISVQNIDCGYSLEPPRRYIKNIRFFLSENFHFLVVKFSIYLNRLVFVMYIVKLGLTGACIFLLISAQNIVGTR